MERLMSFFDKGVLKISLSLFFLAVLFIVAGCQDSVNDADDEPTGDREAMEKIADEDSSLQSFDESYNEGDLLGFDLGKIQVDIYPYRVGQRVKVINRTLTTDIMGDTAYAVLTKTYEGVLLIEASYDSNTTKPDTTIQKPFTSVITRNLVFVRIDSTARPYLNWRLAAISLPEGGVASPNIDITKLSVFLPDGDSLVVNSPNEYYLTRHSWFHWWWRNMPVIPHNSSVLVRVEVFSAYEADDFVTVTFGKNKFGGARFKRKFELVSSTSVSGGFSKVYEQEFRTHVFPGFFHAVINAFPRQVIYDDAAPVENSIWGIPYFVRL